MWPCRAARGELWPFKFEKFLGAGGELRLYVGLAFVFVGLIFSMRPLLTAGIVLFSAAVLFQLVTLPVEYNASSRALRLLSETGILGDNEVRGSKKVLSAAALTYVAALAGSVLQLLRLLILAGGKKS